jgi:transcriptional regulator with XRE-family HTH domain
MGALSAAHTDPRSHRTTRSGFSRLRTGDIDPHVGARMRERRVMFGLTQQQVADLVGITFRQVYNYERGITGVGSGHLYRIAQVLGVEVGYFFEGTGRGDTFKRVQGRRLLLELARNFVAIPVRRHKEEIVSLARALAEPDNKATRPGETASGSEARRTAQAHAQFYIDGSAH